MSAHKDRDPRQHLPAEYGRVTNAERFRPLHAIAIDLLDRATRLYHVRRTDGYGVDVDLEASSTLARETVVLTPYHALEGPLVVAFSTFPGLRVRFGRWCCLAFPACGCDACHETAEGEGRRFTWMAENLIAGRFREAIIRDRDTVLCEWETWNGHSHQLHRSRLLADEGQLPLAENGAAHHWHAWSLRHSAPGEAAPARSQ